MAKLIYLVTALALGALVSGFFVDTSSVPLIASIVLSAIVMLLILFGWSRRIRRGIDLMGDEPATGVPEMEEITIAEVDEDEFRRPEPVEETSVLTAVKAKPKATPKAKPKAKAKPKPKAKPKANKAKAKAAPSGSRPGRVLVIPGRSRYHQAGCRFAKGDQVREVSEATAQRRGYEPCNVCASSGKPG